MGTKRDATPHDGLVAGSSLTIAFLSSIVGAMMTKPGCTPETIHSVLSMLANDETDEIPKLIAACGIGHLSASTDVSEDKINADLEQLTRKFAEALKRKGLDIGFLDGPIIVGRPS